MKSKDLIQAELKENLVQAMKSEDENAIAQALAAFAQSIQEEVLADVKAYQQTADSNILAKRGVHQLTTEETQFYQKVIEAMQSNNPRQAITDLNIAFPETVIDNIMDDIRTAHPLLDAVSFINTSALTKILVNKQGAQLAVWGQLSTAIVTELVGAIGKIDLNQCKLSAFMPISKDMLAVGPAWIDAYVRATLSEAIALALETAIITGTGKDMPIGMDRDVSDGVTVTGGVYPQKAAVALASFDPQTYGAILGTLVQTPTGRTRPVTSVILVVNPIDYFTRVFPATTVRAVDGTYNKDVFPFPTTVIQSAAVAQGKAVIGLARQYFMGLGAGSKDGKIEYSDEYKFLEDERVYLTKLIGNGRALDNNAFILLDITGLVPAQLQVVVSNYEQTPKALTVTSVAGTASGDTKLTVAPSINAGNVYKYKTGTTVTLPKFGQVLTTGWSAWDGTADITAATGHKIVVVEVNAANECKAVGEATVTAKA